MVKAVDITAVLKCRVAVCGDAAVGKTSLTSMLVSKGTKFSSTYNMTCGVECTTAQLPIPDTTVAVDLIISELAGCDVYHSSAGQYLDGTHAALIVFDVSSQTSYEHCKKWLEVLRQARSDKDKPLRGVLVANKMDLPVQRHVVSTQAAKEWANMNGLAFCEASAKPPGNGYEAPFAQLAAQHYKAYESKTANFLDLVTKY